MQEKNNIQSVARERILLKAHELFYRHGIRATGIDRIIAEAGVTKVTFYRHFASKNVLIHTYLEYRHQQWMRWFETSIQQHSAKGRVSLEVLVPIMKDWFQSETFRGCAFLNGVGELAEDLPEILDITQQHKRKVEEVVKTFIPAGNQQKALSRAVVMAMDGAIWHVQFGAPIDVVLKDLAIILKSLG